MRTVLVCAALAALSLTVPAQDKRPVIIQTEHFETAVPPGAAGAMANTFEFVSAEAGISPKLVKGAPYSATAVTESVQTLADGNRISHTTNAAVARDSQGRTRREQSFPALGPWASEGNAPKMTTINDAVAGVTYMLNDREKTARKLQVRTLMNTGAGAAGAKAEAETVALMGSQIHVQALPGAPAAGENIMYIRHAEAVPGGGALPSPKVEQLGQKTIEGVVANGTRTTVEIPAGAVGNDRPIQVVDERWYSSELQTTVMSRHSDPRSGESNFRLSNISRAEPAPALFEVPSDYKVVDGPGSPMEIRIDRSNNK
jgi:hypothetical protein